MLQINPKNFKAIKNKTIPNPMRPKFRNREQSNIYFLSQRKFNGEKKNLMIRRIKLFTAIGILLITGYILSN